MRPQVKTTILVSALGLSVALNVSLVMGYLQEASANADGPAAPDAPGNRCLLDRLQLDVEQRQRLSEMRQKMREKRSAFWRRAAAIKADLAQALSSSRGQPDALLDSYAKNQAEMQRAVADHLLSVNAMLRPDQREGFRTLLRTEMFRGIRPLPAGVVGEP